MLLLILAEYLTSGVPFESIL